MDFGGHGLSPHTTQVFPYYNQSFVSDVRRVATAFKWTRFSILGHSFVRLHLPEMVDKLMLLDTSPFALDFNETENILTYKRRNIEHMLKMEASQKSPGCPALRSFCRVLETGKLRLHIAEDQVQCHIGIAEGRTLCEVLVLNRDRRISLPENVIDFVSKEMFAYYTSSLQAMCC
ncbi:hypothetical protein U0070_019199 [Myodes glareolus]|uniref:Uncharacterized protein n=1 Tax=Myodes glareolus TaxID=447135 RepID=A0AAW0H9P0_MYOGA